ncbi:MAG: hypothetical protein ACI9SK_001696 [Zhongshania sp.]|jgi:hypothetical protein
MTLQIDPNEPGAEQLQALLEINQEGPFHFLTHIEKKLLVAPQFTPLRRHPSIAKASISFSNCDRER